VRIASSRPGSGHLGQERKQQRGRSRQGKNATKREHGKLSLSGSAPKITPNVEIRSMPQAVAAGCLENRRAAQEA
jgi:hypothetical protein